MMQDTFSLLLGLFSLTIFLATFFAVPLRTKNGMRKSPNRLRVERWLPAVILVEIILSILALTSAYAADQSNINDLSFAEMQKALGAPGKKTPPLIAFSPWHELVSSFTLANQSSGIDCQEISRAADGQLIIRGPVHIGGMTISNSTVGPRSFVINGQDLFTVIASKCGGASL